MKFGYLVKIRVMKDGSFGDQAAYNRDPTVVRELAGFRFKEDAIDFLNLYNRNAINNQRVKIIDSWVSELKPRRSYKNVRLDADGRPMHRVRI